MGVRKPGVSLLTSRLDLLCPPPATLTCASLTSFSPHRATVLKQCQDQIVTSLGLFTTLSGSVGQSRGLLTGPRVGEGSALSHTASQWALQGGKEELHSCLGRIEGVGALEGAPQAPPKL